MSRTVRAQSNDPGAAAHEVLEQANFTSETVRLVFDGEIGGSFYKDLTVEVRPGTAADVVVKAMRDEAHRRG